MENLLSTHVIIMNQVSKTRVSSTHKADSIDLMCRTSGCKTITEWFGPECDRLQIARAVWHLVHDSSTHPPRLVRCCYDRGLTEVLRNLHGFYW